MFFENRTLKLCVRDGRQESREKTEIAKCLGQENLNLAKKDKCLNGGCKTILSVRHL